ncbi:DUF2975 domain-containing protein [Streptosporangium soli]|nr:DUF2975 domain-containing protein [Streptosporangium sp. KLBMP 9127]
MSTPSPSREAPPPTKDRWFGRLHVLLQTGIVFGLLAVAAGVLASVLTALPGSHYKDYGVQGLWPAKAEVTLDGALTPGTEVVETSIRMSLHNADHAPVVALLNLLDSLPGMLTALLTLFWLLRITTYCRYSDRALFSTTTASYLRKIGSVLIIGSLVSFALSAAAKAIATGLMTTGGYLLPALDDLPVGVMFVGVGVFVVAEVIRRGLVMFDELEGTI